MEFVKNNCIKTCMKKHHFLKHTITIYPHYENSMRKKKKKKNFLKTKILKKYSHSFRHHKTIS